MHVRGFFLIVLATTVVVRASDSCECERHFSPVCGSDGMTYNNECRLACTPHVRLVYQGTCCPLPYCPPYISAVCDSEGNTHSNECVFNYNKCIVKKSYGRLIAISGAGPCAQNGTTEVCSLDACPPADAESPVCDVTSVTHASLCHFHYADCRQRAVGRSALIMAYRGACFNGDAAQQHDEMPFYEENDVMVENEALASVTTTVTPTTHKTMSLPSLIVTESPLTANPMSGTFETSTDSPASSSTTIPGDVSISPVDAPPTVLPADIFSIDLPTTTTEAPIDPSRQCAQLACVSSVDAPNVCDDTDGVHVDECAFQRARCLVELVDVDHTLIRVPCVDDPSALETTTTTMDLETTTMELEMSTPKLATTAPLSCEHLTACTKEHAPICDSDGRTHVNLCMFELNACLVRLSDGRDVSIVNDGPCPPPDGARHEVARVDVLDASEFLCEPPSCEGEPTSPICDSSGTTHENMCAYHHARCVAAESRATTLSIAYDGACLDATDVCATFCAPSASTPLCADNLVTYASECHFRNAQCEQHSLDGSVMQVLFADNCSACVPPPGSCLTADEGRGDEGLVCDSMQATRSECEFMITDCIYYRKFDEHLQIAHRGRCCTPCSTPPALDDTPICDTRNMTHASMCEFESAACKARHHGDDDEVDVEMGVKYEGACSVLRETDMLEEPKSFDCTTACNAIYAPVCDIDTQTTYASACAFGGALCDLETESPSIVMATRMRDGECCDAQCPDNHLLPSYVCDTNGVTHNSLCELGVHRCRARQAGDTSVEFAVHGVCEESAQCLLACDDSLAPVCGTDGRSYVNACHMSTASCIAQSRAEDMTMAHAGRCCSLSACTFEYAPVCDSRAVTHVNPCAFHAEHCASETKTTSESETQAVTIAYAGECCERACTRDYTPVCDTRNVTHSNQCAFDTAHCLSTRTGDSSLSIAYSGECCRALDCSLVDEEADSEEAESRVCDSDGVTHVNECALDEHICIAERRDARIVRYMHDGECCLPPICTKEYAPVCASDGVTYGNRCQWEHRACIALNVHNVTVDVRYEGECCVDECPGTLGALLEVCDQDGAMYASKCHFDVSSCEAARAGDRRLRLLAPCPPRSHQTRQRRLDRVAGNSRATTLR